MKIFRCRKGEVRGMMVWMGEKGDVAVFTVLPEIVLTVAVDCRDCLAAIN